MPPGVPHLADRTAALASERADLEREISRLSREEQYLSVQIEHAQEQVRYYEGLIEIQRREWTRRPGVRDVIRGLG